VSNTFVGESVEEKQRAAETRLFEMQMEERDADPK
jgi:hypothetical protein